MIVELSQSQVEFIKEAITIAKERVDSYNYGIGPELYAFGQHRRQEVSNVYDSIRSAFKEAK